MIKSVQGFYSYISTWTGDHTPGVVSSTLNTVAPIVTDSATWISRGLLIKQIIDAYRGDSTKREIKEEAALLGRMRREPEEFRGLGPEACKKAREVSDRLFLRTAQSSPSAEVVLDLRKLMENSVDQCVWCPKQPK